MSSIGQEYIEKEKAHQIQEIRRRNSLYRKSSPKYNFQEKTVILVDDGAATGATTIVAARWIRNQPTKPKKIIIAMPVTSKEITARLQQECNRLEIKSSLGFIQLGYIYSDKLIKKI